MRRPRAGDDNGDNRYDVRVDEPRRHLSSPLLPFSFSPPFSFFFFLLPFFSFLLSFLLFLLPPPPSYSGRGGRTGAGPRRAGARAGEPAAAARRLRRRRRSGYGAAAGRLRRACVCVSGVCMVCVVSGFFIFQTSLPSARSGALGKESILSSAPDLALGEIKN